MTHTFYRHSLDTGERREHGERGMALITALLGTALMLALGMAVVFSATTDTVTTKSQRVSEQAFFAADAGIAIARSALVQALQEKINAIKATDPPAYYSAGSKIETVYVMPDPAADKDYYREILDRARDLANNADTANVLRGNGVRYEVTYSDIAGRVTPPPAGAATGAEDITLRYAIQVTGRSDAGGVATVNETGKVSIIVTIEDKSKMASVRNFSFSGFAAFFDYGDTTASSALAAGTFTGPVHTNSHFAFRSNRNVVFRNIVSQVDDYIRYDSSDFIQGHRTIPTADIGGIDISDKEGYKRTEAVPLPDNSFSQEYAVINGTGITDMKDGKPVDPLANVTGIPTDADGNPIVFDSFGRVTVHALAANLRGASNNPVTVSGGKLNGSDTGVYVSSGDGEKITGAGIYVKGDVSDLQLYADGAVQVYVIRQGSTTTTVRVSPSNGGTTSISSGSKTANFDGVPTDKSNPEHPRPGVSLFVDGSINSLRGGTVSGTTARPAVASDTRLTLTAQRDITITGDLKYADAVVNSDGTPVTDFNSVENVLGIFTNNGNVNLAPNTNYITGPGRSLEMNAAVVSFNSKNDGASERPIEGSIVYTGTTPGSGDKWKLVGSRVQSKINNIGYNNRDNYFDVRFSGGTFAPPFFPGTKYKLAEILVPGGFGITAVDDAKPTGLSWFRDNN